MKLSSAALIFQYSNSFLLMQKKIPQKFFLKMRYYIWSSNYKAVMRQRVFMSMVNFYFFFDLVQSF